MYIPKHASEIIAILKADGSYEQKGNPRMFAGASRERITLYDTGDSIGSEVVVTNSSDAEKVLQDLSLLIEGAAQDGRKR